MVPEGLKTYQELRREFEENCIQFILTELDTAATFCDLALSSSNPERTRRNTTHACTGYKTALHMAKKANLQGDAKEEFDRRVARVRDSLRNLGQEV